MTDPIQSLIIQITLVASVALGIAALLRRRPAARHAVLASGLIVIALGPAWNSLAKLKGLQHLSPSPVEFVAVIVPSADVARASLVVQNGLPAQRQFDWESALLLVWLIGAAMLFVRQAYCWYRVGHEARRARECPMFADSGVRLSDSIPGPMSVGLFRPLILVPADLPNMLSRRQFAQIIEHERAHAQRCDHLVAALQQFVAILFWPHPLIHWLNRSLDRAREECCDNVVLASHGAADYARTLLQISQWMSDRAILPGRDRAALALLGSPWNLGKRIEDLLDERRNLMPRARFPLVIVSVSILASMALLISCAAAHKDEPAQFNLSAAPTSPPASPTTQPGDLRPIAFTVGDRDFFDGDDIQIKQVRCTANTFTPGEIIEVTGTYDLRTAAEANLHLYLTASANEPHAPELSDQGMIVKRGKGEFRLRETLSCQGWPHITFYSNKSGTGFGGVYFGDGKWLLAKAGWESYEKNAAKVTAEP